MSRQAKINIILLLLAALLLGWIRLTQRSDEAPPIPLTQLHAQDINRVELVNGDGLHILLERTADRWRIRAPEDAPANAERIETLLRICSTPSHSQHPLPEDRLADFSLAPPKYTLKINDTALDFGGLESLSQRRYVRVGETLHLIDDGFYPHLIAGINAWREPPATEAETR